ncbi:hypothetical protein N9R39_01035 [Amylibacter sp.]|nr:hypothetical protein [Amylibacter sp.]
MINFFKKRLKVITRSQEISRMWNKLAVHQSAEVIKYLQNLNDIELQQKISEITFEMSNKSQITNSLEYNGISLVKNFLNAVKCDECANDIKKIISSYSKTDAKPWKNLKVVDDGSLSYGEMSNYTETVVNIRSGDDKGMIDIFNIDKLMPSFESIKESLIQSKLLQEIFNEKDLKASNLNVYINQGITKTRGFHIDTFAKKIKFFIYLTDVNTLDDGPYCFVKKTHINTPLSNFHKEILRYPEATTDSLVLDIEDVIPVLADRGNMIISDQSGIHRGFPQKASGYRAVIVLSTG